MSFINLSSLNQIVKLSRESRVILELSHLCIFIGEQFNDDVVFFLVAIDDVEKEESESVVIVRNDFSCRFSHDEKTNL